MAGIFWRAWWFGLYLLICAGVLSAQETRLVSVLGQHPRIELQGCQSIASSKILRALNRDSDYQAILLSHAPLSVFQDRLAAAIRNQYEDEGFARAEVRVKLSEAGSENLFSTPDITVVVEIQEGHRYPAGQIELIGNRFIDAKRLLRDLQEGDSFLPDSASGLRAEESSANRQVPFVPPGITETKTCWKAGLVIPSNAGAVTKITDRIKTLLAHQGLMWARVSVKIEPRDDTKTSVLMINFEREGPLASVGKIQISGQTRNSADSILRLLDLPIGSAINSGVLAAARNRLYHSARFQKFELKFDLENPPVDGAVNLTLEVRENELVPLLTDRLSEEQEVLLKFGRWQEIWGHRTTPYRLSVADCPLHVLAPTWYDSEKGAVVDIEAMLIPQKAIYLSWVLKPASDSGGRRSFKILIDVNQIDCVFPEQRLRMRFVNPSSHPGSTTRLIASHMMKPIAEPTEKDGKKTMQWKYGLGLDGKRLPEASAIQFAAEIAPVTMLDLTMRSNAKCHFDGSELVLDWNGTMFRIERETGELNSFTSSTPQSLKNSIELRKDPDALQRIRVMMNTEGQGFQTWNGDQPSIACALALIWNQIDTHEPIGLSEAKLSSIRWFESVIREALAINEQKSEPKKAAIDPSKRVFPNRFRSCHFEQISDSSPFFGQCLILYYDDYFARQSSFWDMSRFISVSLSRNISHREFRLDPTTTMELGPLSHLYGTAILYAINDKSKGDLATQGRKNLNAALFGQELRGLTSDESVCGHVILTAAKKFSNFSDVELRQFAIQLEMIEHLELLNQIRTELANTNDEQQFRESTITALIRLWSPVIRPRLSIALEALAPQLPVGPGSSNLGQEIRKERLEKN